MDGPSPLLNPPKCIISPTLGSKEWPRPTFTFLLFPGDYKLQLLVVTQPHTQPSVAGAWVKPFVGILVQALELPL